MFDLIEKLERAASGSCELDARIHIALFDPLVVTDPGGYKPDTRPVVREHASKVFTDTWDWSPVGAEAVAVSVGAPRYTTSLDAALTLVPGGYRWAVSSLPGKFRGEAVKNGSGQPHYIEHSATPALALCIAGLKARHISVAPGARD